MTTPQMNDYDVVFVRIHETVKTDEFGQRSPWIGMGIRHKDDRLSSGELHGCFSKTEPHLWRGQMNYTYLAWNSARAAMRDENTEPDHIFEVAQIPLVMAAELRDDVLPQVVDEITREALRGQNWEQEQDRVTARFKQLPTIPNATSEYMQRHFYRRGRNFIEWIAATVAGTKPDDPRLLRNRFAAMCAAMQPVAIEPPRPATPPVNTGAIPPAHAGPTLAMRRTNRGTGSRPDPRVVMGVLNRIKRKRAAEGPQPQSPATP